MANLIMSKFYKDSEEIVLNLNCNIKFYKNGKIDSSFIKEGSFKEATNSIFNRAKYSIMNIFSKNDNNFAYMKCNTK